jgi:hypothetical protein
LTSKHPPPAQRVQRVSRGEMFARKEGDSTPPTRGGLTWREEARLLCMTKDSPWCSFWLPLMLVNVRQGRLPQAGVHGSSPRTASSTLDPGPMQQRGSFQHAPEDFKRGSLSIDRGPGRSVSTGQRWERCAFFTFRHPPRPGPRSWPQQAQSPGAGRT